MHFWSYKSSTTTQGLSLRRINIFSAGGARRKKIGKSSILCRIVVSRIFLSKIFEKK
jgi:hypothetical protein